MSRLDNLLMRDNEILQAAEAAVPRDETGHFSEDALRVELIKGLKPVLDVKEVFDKHLEKRAKEIIRAAQRPGSTEPNGQLDFGFAKSAKPIDYYPHMLVQNGQGQLIEQARSPLETEIAKQERERENLERVMASYEQTVAINERFAAWSGEQNLAGRPFAEIVFDNFVRETGVWRPSPTAQQSAA